MDYVAVCAQRCLEWRSRSSRGSSRYRCHPPDMLSFELTRLQRLDGLVCITYCIVHTSSDGRILPNPTDRSFRKAYVHPMLHPPSTYGHCCVVRYAEVLGVSLIFLYKSPISTDPTSAWRARISLREAQTQESWRSLSEEVMDTFRAEQTERKWGFGID